MPGRPEEQGQQGARDDGQMHTPHRSLEVEGAGRGWVTQPLQLHMIARRRAACPCCCPCKQLHEDLTRIPLTLEQLQPAGRSSPGEGHARLPPSSSSTCGWALSLSLLLLSHQHTTKSMCVKCDCLRPNSVVVLMRLDCNQERPLPLGARASDLVGCLSGAPRLHVLATPSHGSTLQVPCGRCQRVLDSAYGHSHGRAPHRT